MSIHLFYRNCLFNLFYGTHNGALLKNINWSCFFPVHSNKHMECNTFAQSTLYHDEYEQFIAINSIKCHKRELNKHSAVILY